MVVVVVVVPFVFPRGAAKCGCEIYALPSAMRFRFIALKLSLIALKVLPLHPARREACLVSANPPDRQTALRHSATRR